jgi:hypothetical protein
MDERALASIFHFLRKKRLNSQSGELMIRGSIVGEIGPTVAGSISARFNNSSPSLIEAEKTRR